MHIRQSISRHLGSDLKFLLRALRYRNYRLFFAGQSVSLIGSWMQMVAVSWLVYRLTDSAFLLGVVAFTSQIPILFVSPIAGVLADKGDRRRLLIITQVLAMAQALILAILYFTGTIAVWHIIALGIFIGFVNAFDAPVRQAFVVDMVEYRRDLGNAIALNSSMFNGARLIGPAAAGVLIAAAGEGVCFALNAASFLAVIVALRAMRLKPAEPAGRGDTLAGLRDGFAHAFGSRPIRAILLLVSLGSLLGMSYVVLMPIVAQDILHGGSEMLGFLMGATGLGALIGAVHLASRTSVLGLEKTIVRGAAIFGIGLVAFAFSSNAALSLTLMLMTGFGMMVMFVSCNTVVQNLVHDDKRGRVMALYTIAFLGIAPFGSLLAGSLAAEIGARLTLAVSGVSCIIGAALFTTQLGVLRDAIERQAAV